MYLLYAYIASLVVGGILLGASLLLGQDSDADADVEAMDVDADVESAGGHDIDLDHGGGLSEVWLPFVSLRFWVFFLTFFGATGSILSLLALAGRWTTLIAALLMGSLIGFVAAYVIQKLKQQVFGEVPTEESFKGQEGVVLLPLSPEQQGKVRLNVHDHSVDLPARTDEGTLAEGSKVLVIDYRDHMLVVVPAPELQN